MAGKIDAYMFSSSLKGSNLEKVSHAIWKLVNATNLLPSALSFQPSTSTSPTQEWQLAMCW